LAVLALSSRLIPASNLVPFQNTDSRKLTPPARFILPGAVFHRDWQSVEKMICHLKNPCGGYNILIIVFHDTSLSITKKQQNT
jgi:hypothetical protein